MSSDFAPGVAGGPVAGHPARGTPIDSFVITRQLPPGKHATVFQARASDGSFAALKLATSPQGVELLRREHRMLEALGLSATPAVSLLSAGHAAATPYVAMSWIAGAEVRLAAREIRDHGSPADMVDLCCAIARAYASLHTQLLHNQPHPRHLLVDALGVVCILDLSLAGCADDAPPEVALSARFGSLSAPETAEAVLQGEALPLTAAAEQYSIGALLYLLVTGRMYARFALERQTLAAEIPTKPPLAFTELGLGAWPEIEAILGRALAKAPHDRFASVREMQLALEELSAAPPSTAPRRIASVSPELVRVLESFVVASKSDEMIRSLVPPTGSINFGAAGVAFALTRLGKLTQDRSALELAERWLADAESRMTDSGAFDDARDLTAEVVGLVSPFHTASGVAAARAFLSHATADSARQQAALDEFRLATQAPCANLDLTLGRSAVLLIAALLYANSDRGWPATRRLEIHGNELCAAIWASVAEENMTYYGIAHGWAGVAYASMMWATARGIPPPIEVRPVLDLLAAAAEPVERGACWPLTPPGSGSRSSPAASPPTVGVPGWCRG